MGRKVGMGCGVMVVMTMLTAIKIVTAATQPNRGCRSTCGNLTDIQFPFGTGPDCYLDDSFLITCNETNITTPQAFLRESDIPVLSVSLLEAQMRIAAYVYWAWYNQSGYSDDEGVSNFLLGVSKFPLSHTLNKFTTVGCATAAIIKSNRGNEYTTGCISVCNSYEGLNGGSCDSGVGCCQTTIPKEMRGYDVTIQSFGNCSSVQYFNPYSYAFVVEEKAFNFSEDLHHLRRSTRLPVVLDWAVGNETCQQAHNNASGYACRSSNSECINSTNGPGYRCNCSSGFQGNPYLVDGCQDIDECKIPNICGGDGSNCTNVNGNYSCSCEKGYELEGTSCTKKSPGKGSTWVNISLGISISLLLLLVGSSFIYLMLYKRKLVQRRKELFDQNGGLMLKQQLSEHRGSVEIARIFSAEDLKKATNNYDESRVIGQGGYGTVYKGVLPDKREVAIKKSKISDQSQIEQFINEVVILSQINHRNVVKLVGCCLETEVPLLVYEFITNGTLSDHIHNENRASKLSWKMRLKIAVETAVALAYLHSETSIPIIHRDVKSNNILLDDTYTTKVSDFGASRLIPLNQAQLTTLVQGTFGYLDPEYFQSSQLTEKSDVYSFGVVLAELLTGEKALSFDRTEEDRNLAMYFVSSMKEHRLLDILEEGLMEDAKIEHLKEIAMLTKRCLNVKGDKRPTMKEVAMELEGLIVVDGNLSIDINLNLEESENLLNQSVHTDAYNGFLDGGNGSTTIGYDSMRDQTMVPLEFR